MNFFKYAIVDIGANSVRMNIYDINTSTGEFFTVDSVRNMMGLASYVVDGNISADGAGKLSAIIRDYLARANSYPCDKFSAFATASLRGVSNAVKLISNIKERYGVDIEIISGTEEAKYDFDAIRAHFGKDMYDNGVVIDMGGGSTEFIRFSCGKAEGIKSLPIGCVMLGRNFIPEIKKSLFPNKVETEKIEEYIKDIISDIPDFKNKGENIYLIGGTGRAMAKIDSYISGNDVKNTDGYTFNAANLKGMRDFLFEDAATGALTIRKLISDRLTTVIPGVIAYDVIFDFLGAKNVTVSASGVREGYLLSFIEKNFSRKVQEI